MRIYTIVYKYTGTVDYGFRCKEVQKIGKVQVSATNWIAAKLKAIKQYNIKAENIIRCI